MNVTNELLEQEFDETELESDNDQTEEEEVEAEEEEESTPEPENKSAPVDPALLEILKQLAETNAKKEAPKADDDVPEDVMYDPKKFAAYVDDLVNVKVKQYQQVVERELEAIKKPALVSQIATAHGIASEAATHLAESFSSGDLEYLLKNPGFAKFVGAVKGKATATTKTKVPTQTPKSTKPAPKGPQLDDIDKEVLATYERRYGKDSKEYKERRTMLLGGK